MNDIYIITSGEYSDYGIVSVWSDEAEANRVCELLNKGYQYAENYRVEKYALDYRSNPYDKVSWFAEYNYKTHGYSVDVENMDTYQGITSFPQPVRVSHLGLIRAQGSTEEQARRVVFDEVARLHAVTEGVADGTWEHEHQQ